MLPGVCGVTGEAGAEREHKITTTFYLAYRKAYQQIIFFIICMLIIEMLPGVFGLTGKVWG